MAFIEIMGLSYVTNDKLFAVDDSGTFVEASAGINASTAPVSVGELYDPDFRVYVGTRDGKVALFARGNLDNPPQMFQVTDKGMLWSLYHAAGVVYAGTGDYASTGPFSLMALDDQTLAPRWQVSSTGRVLFPVGVAYEGKVPKQVIFSSGNPGPSVRALDVATGAELWNAPDYANGQKIHKGVVYYGNYSDNTLYARSAIDGTLLWSFVNPSGSDFNRPVAAGDVVWASTADAELFAFGAMDGSVLWEVQLDGQPGVPVVHFDHKLNISLVAVAEHFGAAPGYLKALDPNTGAGQWTSSAPVSQQGFGCTDPIVIPSFENGLQVQVGTSDGTLMTFNAVNGQLVWQRQLSPGSALVAKPHWAKV